MNATIEHAAHIIAMTRQGATQEQIGVAVGLSVQAVRRRQIRLAVRPSRKRSRPATYILQWSPAVQALWDGPMLQSAIAVELGVSRTALKNAAVRAGQYPRATRRGMAPKVKPKRIDPMDGLTPAQFADVQVYRRAGYTLKDALAKVTTPKVRIRFAIPAQEARA